MAEAAGTQQIENGTSKVVETSKVESARVSENSIRSSSSSSSSSRMKFMEVYKQLAGELVQDSSSFHHTDESRAWISEMLEYNVPGGKLNRGLSVIDSLKLLKKVEKVEEGEGAEEGEENGSRSSSGSTQLSEEDSFRACVLGWCIEWMQAFFLVSDDIMDKSITRRGKPCWYKVPKVGFIAINDGILMSCHVFRMLKIHFRELPIYTELFDLFNEVIFQTSSGQLLDLITSPPEEEEEDAEGGGGGGGRVVDLSKYTMPTYLRIVQYKTAYYSFYLPVACAMLLAGEVNLQRFETVKSILVQMGTYFQVQDDFLDCFGDPEFIGKVGTDIADCKCSWLVVRALQDANQNQKDRIKAHYGKRQPEHVDEIKKIYNELDLITAFQEYENKSYKDLVDAIAAIDSKAYQGVLHSFLSKIYKRTK